jgi:hypothetical protein
MSCDIAFGVDEVKRRCSRPPSSTSSDRTIVARRHSLGEKGESARPIERLTSALQRRAPTPLCA